VQLSFDRKYIVGVGKGLDIWSLDSGEHILRTDTDATSLQLCADGNRYLTVGPKTRLQLSSLEEGRNLRRYDICGAVARIYPDGRHVLLRHDGLPLQVWDIETEAVVLTFTSGYYFEMDILSEITPDGCCVVSGGSRTVLRTGGFDHGALIDSGQMEVWNLAQAVERRRLIGHSRAIRSIKVSPDGRMSVSLSDDETVRVWDLKTGQCCRTFDISATSVCFSGDGQLLVCAGKDKCVRVLEIRSGRCLAVEAFLSEVTSVAIHANRVIGADFTGRIIVLNLENVDRAVPFVTLARLWKFGNDSPWRRALRKVVQPVLHGVRLHPRGTWDSEVGTNCVWCGRRFSPATEIVETISGIAKESGHSLQQSPCLDLPGEAWNEPRLIIMCPACHGPLRFNPFVVDNHLACPAQSFGRRNPVG
jgi:WD40 repeat protein